MSKTSSVWWGLSWRSPGNAETETARRRPYNGMISMIDWSEEEWNRILLRHGHWRSKLSMSQFTLSNFLSGCKKFHAGINLSRIYREFRLHTALSHSVFGLNLQAVPTQISSSKHRSIKALSELSVVHKEVANVCVDVYGFLMFYISKWLQNGSDIIR